MIFSFSCQKRTTKQVGPAMPPTPDLVLASTSPYRRELLQRLRIPFRTASPDVDESPHPGETPADTATRLAEAKARVVAGRYPNALIIGSDQVAYVADRIYGKPGTRERAAAQLRELRGRSVHFHTALCLFNCATGGIQVDSVPIEVHFRHLGDDEIERYLDIESPLNCAGSARSEGLGISLLDYIRGDDPNALIGLPLISLCRMLRREGVALP